VHKLKHTPLNYAVLAELGTRPRTTYLARVRNPHHSLAKGDRFDTPVPGDGPTGYSSEKDA
jgi:molybdopterin-containing oxidoreductase family iron-sulfur binding subunit